MKNLLPKLGNQLTKNGFLENKVFFIFFSKNFINKSWSPSLIFFKEKKLSKFGWFLTLKEMTWKVQNWYIFSADLLS
jgi:hypothetical protein